MPNCRNCGSRLSRFDKDMCPICGVKDPFLGMSTDTNEITSEIETVKEIKDYRPKSKKTIFILSLFFGFTGASFYYLRYIMTGIIWSIVNLICSGAIFATLFFLAKIDIALSCILSISLLLICNIILSVVLTFKTDLKDGRGEFVR